MDLFKGHIALRPQVEGLLPSMKNLRGGATAIDRVLDIATGWALSEAQRQLNGGARGAPVELTDFRERSHHNHGFWKIWDPLRVNI
jgi:hypothetical protein